MDEEGDPNFETNANTNNKDINNNNTVKLDSNNVNNAQKAKKIMKLLLKKLI